MARIMSPNMLVNGVSKELTVNTRELELSEVEWDARMMLIPDSTATWARKACIEGVHGLFLEKQAKRAADRVAEANKLVAEGCDYEVLVCVSPIIALAQNWLLEHKDLTGQALMQEVDKQSWDPSVKALTAFPSVLDNMAKNLAWTSELGEVYNHQPSDVMQAVQALRVKAKDAGNLKTTSQITVVQQSPSTIVIQPANPQVIYVPEYNPAVVFGTPYVVPGYTAGEVAAASAISFGAGIAIGALMSGGCCHTWGWNTWTVDWHGGYVGYAGHPYYGSSAWHGAYGAYGYHGYGAYGSASYHGPYGSAGAYHGYGANGGYHTGGCLPERLRWSSNSHRLWPRRSSSYRRQRIQQCDRAGLPLRR